MKTVVTPINLCEECGWMAGPGEAIACDDPRHGPFFCPRCQRRLGERKAAGAPGNG